MKIKLFTFLLFCTTVSFAQKIDTIALKKQLILTSNEHEKWLDSLVKIERKDQLGFILQRKVLDTNIYTPKLFPDAHLYKGRFPNQCVPGKFLGCCKPVLIIYWHKKKNLILIGEASEKKQIDALLKIKNEIIINKLTIFKDAEATALYGSIGASGVIYMDVLDKKSMQLLDKIN